MWRLAMVIVQLHEKKGGWGKLAQDRTSVRKRKRDAEDLDMTGPQIARVLLTELRKNSAVRGVSTCGLK
jgi:hypothetical protein